MINVKTLPEAEAVQHVRKRMRQLVETAKSRSRTEVNPPDTTKPKPEYVPLVEQIEAVLIDWPPAMQARISISVLLPLLQGRYRSKPHAIGVAKALRRLGYVPARSWKSSDHARRYWVKP